MFEMKFPYHIYHYVFLQLHLYILHNSVVICERIAYLINFLTCVSGQHRNDKNLSVGCVL